MISKLLRLLRFAKTPKTPKTPKKRAMLYYDFGMFGSATHEFSVTVEQCGLVIWEFGKYPHVLLPEGRVLDHDNRRWNPLSGFIPQELEDYGFSKGLVKLEKA